MFAIEGVEGFLLWSVLALPSLIVLLVCWSYGYLVVFIVSMMIWSGCCHDDLAAVSAVLHWWLLLCTDFKQCKTGELIHELFWCDGHINCRYDHADEINCTQQLQLYGRLIIYILYILYINPEKWGVMFLGYGVDLTWCQDFTL